MAGANLACASEKSTSGDWASTFPAAYNGTVAHFMTQSFFSKVHFVVRLWGRRMEFILWGHNLIFTLHLSYSVIKDHITLRWHHNERDGITNYRLLDCLLNHLFRSRSKKTPKLRVTGYCEGNSPMTSPHKRPVTRKMFPLDYVIMIRRSGGRLNKKDGLTRYGNSHVKDKTS